jgi:hypothetical protein
LHHAADSEDPHGFELLDVLLPDAEICGKGEPTLSNWSK